MTHPVWPPAQDAELIGRTVRVRPTVISDTPDLFRALDTAAVWAHLTLPRPRQASELEPQVEEALTQRFPWTVRLAADYRELPAGAVVGWSSYLEVSPSDARLEIGSTAYDPGVWRSAVNTETKLLLLSHAFDQLQFQRVQLKTDIRNERSIAGIVGLGAVREGVLRSYQRRVDGSIRDTVVFSIVAAEWPAVKAALTDRLATR